MSGPTWALMLAILTCASTQDDSLFELTIIHYNDFHAHFDEVSPTGAACNPSEAACVGGFARLYTAHRQAREVAPDAILLNGGDTFQGTIWYNFLRWNVSYVFMNMLPHDAHVLGNHEFDHGPEGLLPYLQNLNSPMLGANVNATFEPELDEYIQNHVVITRNGRSIGIVGVLLRQFSAPLGQVIMEDEVAAVNREVELLVDQGIDIIIVLSHIGFDSDQRIAHLISPEVDIIVGAHSHTLLYTGTPPGGGTPLGEYPHVVTRTDGHRIPIVQASAYTRYLGVIKLFIDTAGVVQRWEGEPVYLGTSIIPDPQILELLAPWREEVDAVGKEVLGRSLVSLSSSCSAAECNLGSWACDGFLEEMMSRATEGRWNDAHVCLINTGGLRVQLDPGDVTTEALLMAMPFENYVQVYDLKGEYLRQALEFSVGTAQTPGQFSSSRMLQVGGIRVVYNASAPANSRIVSAQVRCIECDVPRYEPLDVDKTYRVVTQNYIGDGGGGYTMISNNRENLENLEVDYVILQRFMRKQGVVTQGRDGRIQIVY